MALILLGFKFNNADLKFPKYWQLGMKMYKLLVLISLILVLAACDSRDGSGDNNIIGISPKNCFIEGQNEFVYDVMKEIYLYSDQLPVVDPLAYGSPEELLEDLIVSPDRFSTIADQQSREDFFQEGTYQGFGFSYQDDGDAYIILLVFEDSPAGRAGLERGDRITSINGDTYEDIEAAGGVGDYFNNYKQGDILIFSVDTRAGSSVDIMIAIDLVNINTVLTVDVIESNGLNVGYLALSSFITPTNSELVTAFETLFQANIDELVLDLRYNGGGLVSTAQRLASYIAGADAVGADTSRLLYNDKYSDNNENNPFLPLTYAVNLKRLYVLTLGGTCSASELVINAMDPVNIDVVTVGETTCGKPVGSVGIDFCNKTLVPISFDVVNDLGQGGYFDGFDAVCSVADDLTADFADPSEAMFATALSHISNGQCPAVVARSVNVDPAERKRELLKSYNIMDNVY